MRRITILDRILTLLAVCLASYQVVAGIEGLDSFAVSSYTIGFGILLVAGLLLIILGFEVLESPHVVVFTTILPLSLSVGLLDTFYPGHTLGYLLFAVTAFLAVILTRYLLPGRIALVVLGFTHAVAGLLIFLLPFVVSLQGAPAPAFAMVGIGGGLIGVYGLLLSFARAGKPLLSLHTLLGLFPVLLLLATFAFVIGFSVL